MFEWLSTEGAALKHHIPGETNYLSQLKGRDDGDLPRPFPNNPNYISESILSEDLRNEVYVRVVEQKKSLRAVSVQLGIDMKRIAAVVRLVELERRQRAQVCLSSTSFHRWSPMAVLSPTQMMSQQKFD